MKVKLKDISITKGSYGINASAVDKVSQKQVSYLRITDIDEFGNIRSKNMKTVDSKDYEKYLLQKNDIVFARTGNSVGKNYFYDERDGKLVYAGFLVKFSLNEDKVYPKYFKYFAQTNKCQGWIKNMASDGSTRPNINAQQLGNIELDLPVYSRQKSIADKLSIIDDKMRLNEQINANLDELLSTIYNNLISGKANNASLKDICSLSNQKISVSDLQLNNYWSNTNLLPNKAGAKIADKLPKVKNVNKVESGDVLFGNIRPYFKKIMYASYNGGASTDVVCFHPNSTFISEYLYSIIYSDKFISSVVKSSKGTKMPRGDKHQMMNYKIYLPNEEEVSKFHKRAKVILRKKQSNNDENKRLNELRNLMLTQFF